jgi:anhydro-N-acetylmuramic acid kinase
MVYRAIGVMSGSSLDGLDIACVEFETSGGRWKMQVLAACCEPYTEEWTEKLRSSTKLAARDYLLLHSEYGHYIGKALNRFIDAHELQYRVGLISSHGHTSFHLPPMMTGQLGCGAAIAAETGLPVVNELRAMDLAFGGQGAPIVPMGEKMLWGDHAFFLNIGGIANVSWTRPDGSVAFDICPANRVLNMLAAKLGQAYDAGGAIAASGKLHQALLAQLNNLPYYGKPYPKSLANDFGTETVYPLLGNSGVADTADLMRTYVEHIAQQTRRAMLMMLSSGGLTHAGNQRMMVTGGGAFNHFLVQRIAQMLEPLGIVAEAAEPNLVNYKEAIVMAFLGVLRWREEPTVFSSVTGAREDSVGGALWKPR